MDSGFWSFPGELQAENSGTHRLGLAQKQGWGRTEVPREQQTRKRAVMGACGEELVLGKGQRPAAHVDQDVCDEEGGCL